MPPIMKVPVMLLPISSLTICARERMYWNTTFVQIMLGISVMALPLLKVCMRQNFQAIQQGNGLTLKNKKNR